MKWKLMSLLVVFFIFSQISFAYIGVDTWFESDFKTAEQEWNIIPKDFEKKDLSLAITRGEVCSIMVNAYESLYGSVNDKEIDIFFKDTDNLDINLAYQLGLVSGYADQTFHENELMSREAFFTVINNFIKIGHENYLIPTSEVDRILKQFDDQKEVSTWAKEGTASLLTNELVKGSGEKIIDPKANTTRAQAVVIVKRVLENLSDSECVFDSAYIVDENNITDDYSLESSRGGDRGESFDLSSPLYKIGYNTAKYSLIFGSGTASSYKSAAEAGPNMTSVTVDVWLLDESTWTKYPSTRTFKVNKAIAPVVEQIFLEIFEGDEKFPIKTVGGYSWRSNSKSEHRMGLAIDINPTENYMISSSGTVQAGKLWNPATNPYSIPENGDVVNAFKKYGFAWGGNAWPSNKDYMHFSYFGK